MAVLVFNLRIQLGKGLAQLGEEHHRVKPKSMGSLWRGGDFTHGAADRDQGLWVLRGSDRDQGADQGRPALGHTIELLQQGAHIAGVATCDFLETKTA